MTRAHTTLFTAAAMATCFAFGCGDDASDVPTEQEYNDVAKSLGNVVAGGGSSGEVSSIHDATELSVGVVPFGFAIDASGEVNGNRFGLDYSYSVSCKDAQGNTLDLCNSTTDSASVNVAWNGALSLPPTFMADVSREGDWTLTGMQGPIATLNGESTFDADVSFMNDTQSRSYRFSYKGDYDGVLVQREPHRIVGGSIHYVIDAAHRESFVDGGTTSGSFKIDAVLTFESDGDASFVLDGTHTYDLDLATGNVTLRVAAR
jgi:hypothetical protein